MIEFLEIFLTSDASTVDIGHNVSFSDEPRLSKPFCAIQSEFP